MRSDALSRRDAGSSPKLIHGGGVGIDAEYAADHWDAARLGVAVRRGRGSARFDTITQWWLREAVKQWSRFGLATGCSFSTISAGALGMSRFSRFLTQRHPDVDDETGITRSVLEDYLSWLATGPYSTNTKLLSLSMLRVFLDACRRHDWLSELAHSAVIYEEELPNRDDGLPRFVPEFVMRQLESDASLARLPSPTARHLVIVMIETGMRIGDACTLEFNPIIDDSAGGPCLRFHNLKVRSDQLIPLSAKGR
jgi:site-specific recombinase XerD